MTGHSIFLHPDWILTRYAGWRTVHRDADCLILENGRFPLRRVCILSAISAATFFQRYQLSGFCRGKALVTLKFIPPDEAAAPIAVARGLHPTPDTERAFHKYTFVIDLTSPIEQLWLAMRPTNRSLCKKAEHADIQVRVAAAPSAFDVDKFLSMYGAMARARGLAMLKRQKLEAMFADRRLLFCCAEHNGAILSIALVYLAGDTGMYLYGASPDRTVDGAGQLLQWEIIRMLKARGVCRYDLGGVPRVDEADGIYKFKKGFGGRGLALGPEFCRAPVWYRIMRRCRNWLQRRSV